MLACAISPTYALIFIAALVVAILLLTLRLAIDGIIIFYLGNPNYDFVSPANIKKLEKFVYGDLA